jgi:hypothetical protein
MADLQARVQQKHPRLNHAGTAFALVAYSAKLCRGRAWRVMLVDLLRVWCQTSIVMEQSASSRRSGDPFWMGSKMSKTPPTLHAFSEIELGIAGFRRFCSDYQPFW